MWEEIKEALRKLSLESTAGFLAWLGLATGIPLLFDPTAFAPNSVNAVYPEWMIILWAIFLVAGSLIAIFGLVWKKWYKIRIEQIGLALLATGSFLYGVALVGYGQGSATWLVTATFILFVVACITRFRNLGKVAGAYKYAQTLEQQNQELQAQINSLEKEVDE